MENTLAKAQNGRQTLELSEKCMGQANKVAAFRSMHEGIRRDGFQTILGAECEQHKAESTSNVEALREKTRVACKGV